MANAATMLMDDRAISEFLSIMKRAGRQSQADEYAQLFGSVDVMQKQLNETLSELKTVRKQLDDIQSRKNPVKRAFTAVVEKLEAELNAIQEQLNALKEKLITGAKSAVRSVKEKGMAALNGVFRFFKVKEDLQATIKSSTAAIESANRAINKIEAISNEYHAMGTHTRNIRAVLFGKEVSTQEQKENGKLSKALQGLVRFRRKLSEGMKKRCEAAVAKLENLEKAVQHNRDNKPRKKDILERLDDYKKNPPVQSEVKAPTRNKQKSGVEI